MSAEIERPRLRPLQVFPQEVEGRPVLCLKDPEGITEQVAVLPPGIVPFFFEVFDGKHTLAEIREEYRDRSGGDELPEEDLRSIVSQLDGALLLDSPRFRKHFAGVLEEWRALPSRPAALAGSAYPADPDELRGFLDGFYEGVVAEDTPSPLGAMVIPHLDLRSGGPTAAAGLVGLDRAFDGDRIVILGVGHQHMSHPFTITSKDFETPLGTVPVDDGLFHDVVLKAGSWVLDDEYSHRSEHSVEFAAVLLKHALPDRDFRILPVLCGSLHHLLPTGGAPVSDPLVGAFIETLAEEAPDALIVASVDLSHMGPHYGDAAPLDPDRLKSIESGDREMLDRMADRDGEGFFAHFAANSDERRVCGMSAIYTLLELLPPGPVGNLAAYVQPPFPEPGNTVSICSMTWAR
jgi:AmmeMemoRadiSam system protein B